MYFYEIIGYAKNKLGDQYDSFKICIDFTTDSVYNMVEILNIKCLTDPSGWTCSELDHLGEIISADKAFSYLG